MSSGSETFTLCVVIIILLVSTNLALHRIEALLKKHDPP